jgi:hypothetical protein
MPSKHHETHKTHKGKHFSKDASKHHITPQTDTLKQEFAQSAQAALSASTPTLNDEDQAKKTVKMRFSENKYYNDLDNPIFLKGQVYEIVGADMINRWLKRGGEIVEGETEEPVARVAGANPEEVVANAEKAAEQVANDQESGDSSKEEKSK